MKLLRDFDQRPFVTQHGRDSYLADTGKIFIPPDCAGGGGQPCKLHLFLHGCDVTDSYDVFTQYTGFNEWAMRCALRFGSMLHARATGTLLLCWVAISEFG